MFVDDPKERQFLAESRRKEKKRQEQDQLQAENLMGRFNQAEQEEDDY